MPFFKVPVSGFSVLAGRSVERPSRLYVTFTKRSWHRPMSVQLRPEEARALARALLEGQRTMEKEKRALTRARKVVNCGK